MAIKIALLVVGIVYFISPVDLAPGVLIDDVVVIAAVIAPFLVKGKKNGK